MTRSVNRLILATVFVAGIAAPAAAHFPDKCGPEMENVLKASAAAVASIDEFYALKLDEVSRSEIVAAAKRALTDTVKERLMTGFLFTCIK